MLNVLTNQINSNLNMFSLRMDVNEESLHVFGQLSPSLVFESMPRVTVLAGLGNQLLPKTYDGAYRNLPQRIYCAEKKLRKVHD
jgi:hypothetical protein